MEPPRSAEDAAVGVAETIIYDIHKPVSCDTSFVRVQIQYDRDGVCTVGFDPSPPFINAAFSGLSIAILCCYHLDRK